ncbi:MAG: T9SS type A sorting domain-containing protein [Bacteroidales bacterium]|nr:T9SS type A sorting domain-containing protein [Bacteroidales bacterium]
MKKLLSVLTLSLIIGIGVSNAQNQRIVVLECFTSATCPPCASVNPTLDNLINNNQDKLVAIKYHVDWPEAGDPMNLHNPSDVTTRVGYYSVGGVPTSVGDGTWNNSSGYVTQNLINQWASVASPLEMRMMHYLNDTQDTITVVVEGRAISDINSNNLKLQVGVIENTMTYTSAPCAYSNGERTFHYVMKKMLPNASGTSIPAMAAGDYFGYMYKWPLANVMNVNELTAIAWVQDHSSKNVIQGCKSTNDFEPYYAKQARISSVDHAKKKVCSGTMSPCITVDNLGSETINSLTINVKVNGESIGEFPWSGTIESYKRKNIELNSLSFDFVENNELSFEIATINGAPDDYQSSVNTVSFDEAVLVVNKAIKVVLRTDDHPEAITWEIVNTGTGETVFSGGPYDQAHHTYNETYNITENGCYMFTIYDATGNGLSGGSGLYGLKAGTTTLFSGGKFNDYESNEFSYLTSLNVAETPVNTLNIYPNPSNGTVTVDTEEDGVVSIYNTTGQMVYTTAIEGKTMLNLSNLEKGTYLLVLTNNFGENSKQVIVLQ